MITSLFDYINVEDIDMISITSVISEHLNELSMALDQYYPAEDVHTGNLWIINPVIDNDNSNLNTTEETELIKLSSDLGLKLQFNLVNIYQFCIKTAMEYHHLHADTTKVLLPFFSTYLCETTFSIMTVIKKQHCNRLIVEPTLRITVTSLTPRIGTLVSNQDQQQSH